MSALVGGGIIIGLLIILVLIYTNCAIGVARIFANPNFFSLDATDIITNLGGTLGASGAQQLSKIIVTIKNFSIGIGFAALVVGTLIQLLNTMVNTGLNEKKVENPFKILLRSSLYALLLMFWYRLMVYFISNLFIPIQKLLIENYFIGMPAETRVEGASNVLKNILDGAALEGVSGSFIGILVTIMAATGLFQASLSIMGRYINYLIYIYLGPIAIGFSSNPSTSDALKQWIGGLLVHIMAITLSYTLFNGAITMIADLNDGAILMSVVIYFLCSASANVEKFFAFLGFKSVGAGDAATAFSGAKRTLNGLNRAARIVFRDTANIAKNVAYGENNPFSIASHPKNEKGTLRGTMKDKIKNPNPEPFGKAKDLAGIASVAGRQTAHGVGTVLGAYAKAQDAYEDRKGNNSELLTKEQKDAKKKAEKEKKASGGNKGRPPATNISSGEYPTINAESEHGSQGWEAGQKFVRNARNAAIDDGTFMDKKTGKIKNVTNGLDVNEAIDNDIAAHGLSGADADDYRQGFNGAVNSISKATENINNDIDNGNQLRTDEVAFAYGKTLSSDGSQDAFVVRNQNGDAVGMAYRDGEDNRLQMPVDMRTFEGQAGDRYFVGDKEMRISSKEKNQYEPDIVDTNSDSNGTKSVTLNTDSSFKKNNPKIYNEVRSKDQLTGDELYNEILGDINQADDYTKNRKSTIDNALNYSRNDNHYSDKQSQNSVSTSSRNINSDSRNGSKKKK